MYVTSEVTIVFVIWNDKNSLYPQESPVGSRIIMNRLFSSPSGNFTSVNHTKGSGESNLVSSTLGAFNFSLRRIVRIVLCLENINNPFKKGHVLRYTSEIY